MAWKEHIVTAGHIFPAIGITVAFGVLMYGLFVQKKEAKVKE